MSELIYGIDPGTTDTGWVLWDGKRPVEFGITPNAEFLCRLRSSEIPLPLYVEMIASYGMAVGKETFQTVLWIGRFIETWDLHGFPWQLCYRLNIKVHHCKTARAKDANVTQALKDKYGDKGTRANRGPFFGVSSHVWSAVAIAAYASETNLVCTSKIA